ncbi:MAG: hypothetical protein RIR79_1868 [Pseudomonadota bacterium]|jgi:hypothetical protein
MVGCECSSRWLVSTHELTKKSRNWSFFHRSEVAASATFLEKPAASRLAGFLFPPPLPQWQSIFLLSQFYSVLVVLYPLRRSYRLMVLDILDIHRARHENATAIKPIAAAAVNTDASP